MISLFLGSDDFSKKQHIQDLAKKAKVRLEFFNDLESAPSLGELNSQDLFSGPKIFVLEGLIDGFNKPSDIDQLAQSANRVIFLESKLDKRLGANKQLLANKKIQIQQFDLPHGKDLNAWISQRVKVLGGSISAGAAEELAVRLGRDEAKETKFGGKVVEVKEIFNLWQAEGEIQKLLALANGREMATADVKELVPENSDVDTLAIANAIADNQKTLVFNLLRKFLQEESAADEKEGIIHLNALLAEQFRNVVIVQDFLAQKESDRQILEQTGYKPGRLFIVKKIAGRFAPKKVLEFLTKLKALDEELKTTSTPPRVLLDLIVSQLL